MIIMKVKIDRCLVFNLVNVAYPLLIFNLALQASCHTCVMIVQELLINQTLRLDYCYNASIIFECDFLWEAPHVDLPVWKMEFA